MAEVLAFFPEYPLAVCFPGVVVAPVFFPEELLVVFFPDDGVLVAGGFVTVELLFLGFLVTVWLWADAVVMKNSIIHISNKILLISVFGSDYFIVIRY